TQPPSFGVPSFVHQMIRLSLADAATTSMSPSPSMSAAYTLAAPSKVLAMVRTIQPPTAGVPSFSYHWTESLLNDDESTSRSPSPSMSAVITLVAPSATSDIDRVGQTPVFGVPSLMYQQILSSSNDAESTSMSPS